MHVTFDVRWLLGGVDLLVRVVESSRGGGVRLHVVPLVTLVDVICVVGVIAILRQQGLLSGSAVPIH